MSYLFLTSTLVAALLVAARSAPQCRCTPPDSCWSAVPWGALNASVGGRLTTTADPLTPCIANVSSAACAAALNATDDEFAVTGSPDGFTRTGLFGTWNLTTVQSSYALLAESEADISAGVAFAAAHNLRVTVKGTGHGWFHGGTAGSGSLLIWTHLRRNITFVDAWTPPCGGSAVPAAIVETGVQFQQLYAEAEAAGVFVVGGTCDSVGVGGCWMGGCWGKFSRLYGPAAVNVLEARVVLADGSIVVANNCSNPELFWALRGGGGGTFGVVASFTVRTHAPPRSVLLGNAYITAVGQPAFEALVAATLNVSLGFMTPQWGGGNGFGRLPPPANNTYYANLYPTGFEVPRADGEALLQPLLDFVAQGGPARYPTVTSSWGNWTTANGAPFPWVEEHPDREISTSLVASMSKWAPNVPLLRAGGPAELARVSHAIAEMVVGLPADAAGTFGIDFEKGAAGADPGTVATMLAETSINPIVADAMGLLLVAYRFPELPTLAPSSAVLAALWSRLQRYVVLGPLDPLFRPCAAGAAGNETAAVNCLNALAYERTPALQAALRGVNQTLWAAFPNFGPAAASALHSHEGGLEQRQESAAPPPAHVSGSYYNEGDWWDPEWRRSHWGSDERYARLRAAKDRYDPAGLFVCHHCVGSEDWDADGNCRVPASTRG